jgi:hypothetical protein
MKVKLTNSAVIKDCEQGLIEGIRSDLDWRSIGEAFRTKHHLEFGDQTEYKGGDIVVCGGSIAYKLDFEVKVRLSVIMDRGGNFVDITAESGAPTGMSVPERLTEIEQTTVVDKQRQTIAKRPMEPEVSYGYAQPVQSASAPPNTAEDERPASTYEDALSDLSPKSKFTLSEPVAVSPDEDLHEHVAKAASQVDRDLVEAEEKEKEGR